MATASTLAEFLAFDAAVREAIWLSKPFVPVDPVPAPSHATVDARGSSHPAAVHDQHLSFGNGDGPAPTKLAVHDLIWDRTVLNNAAHAHFPGVDIDLNPLYSEFATTDELPLVLRTCAPSRMGRNPIMHTCIRFSSMLLPVTAKTPIGTDANLITTETGSPSSLMAMRSWCFLIVRVLVSPD